VNVPAPLLAQPSPDTAVANAQAELEHAAVRAGLVNDPLGHVIRAFSTAIGAMRDLSNESVEAVRAVADGARRPMDVDARSDMIKRVVEAAAAGARSEVRTLSRTTMVVAAAAVAGLMGACGLCGWVIGSSSHAANVASTEAGVIAAFRDGSDAAAVWLNFMRVNDAAEVRAECAKNTAKAASGRRACGVALWLDLPRNAGPGTAPVSR